MTIRTFFAKWWPTLLVLAVIAYATLSADPVGADELPPIPHLDKLIHAIMFGGLFSAIVFDRERFGQSHGTRALIVTALVCAACGVLTEVLQNAMHLGRSGDCYDFLADCTGILVAFFAAPPAIARVLRKNRK